MTFLELSEKIMREEQRPLSQKEIWDIAKEKGYNKSVVTKGKTPWATIGSKLYVDIRDNPAKTKFIKLKEKPTRFFLKELHYDSNPVIYSPTSEGKHPGINFKERDLHKYLSYFVYNYGFIYTKTIYHEESAKKKYAQWMHPDIVGVYFPIEEWETEILDISKELGSSGIKLFSYELKKELTFTNLRESYFQAVSNSSWAHEGYLVVAEIETDEDFLHEIKRLNNAFGIGIIKLDIEDPDASEILYQARAKDFVDIETMNKIAQINPNFKDFLKRIKTDASSREIRKERYDRVYSSEDLAGTLGNNTAGEN